MKIGLIAGASVLALGACTSIVSEPEVVETAADVAELTLVEETVGEAPTEEAIPIIDRSAIFGNPEQTQGRISPDGAYISWIAPVDGVLNVWVAPADDPAAAKAVTSDSYRGIRSHFWAPNSQFVYFVQDNGGDENFHVYASNVETGEVKDLTPVEDGVRATIQGVSSERPDHLLVGINERNPQIFDLYLVDSATGERELVKENPGYAGWIIDNTLTPRFGIVQTAGGGSDIVDMDGGVLLSIPAEDFLTTNTFGFDKDNSHMFAVDSRGRDTAALVRISAEDGSVEILAENDKADISNVLLHPETYEPLAFATDYLRSEWTPLNDSAAADLDFLKSELSGDLQILSSTDDLSKAIVYSEAAEAPGVYYVYDRAESTLTEMFATRPDLADAPLQPMYPVEIKSRDDLTPGILPDPAT